MRDGWVSGGVRLADVGEAKDESDRRYHVPVRVRWRDLDAYNHVNNATLLTLLEEARTYAFWRTAPDDPTPERPLAVVDAQADAETNTLVQHNEIEYRAPIPYGHEPIDVQIWFSDLSPASAEVSYEVWNPVTASERILHTVARSTIVFIDAATGRLRRMNDLERAAWTPFLGKRAVMRADRRRRS